MSIYLDSKEKIIEEMIVQTIDALRNRWCEKAYLPIKEKFNKYWNALDLMTMKINIDKPEVSIEIIAKVCVSLLLTYYKSYYQLCAE